MSSHSIKRDALRAALPITLPIFTGYWFLGMAYGILMNVSGFSAWYPLAMSLVVYGGSMQYVAVAMLASSFAPLQTFLVTLVIQARHIFYGIAMLDRFKGTGWKRFYLIYGMTDETFSLNYAIDPPLGIDRGWFMFFITLLNQIYWVSASAFGGFIGNIITFNTEGIDFVMTAMFIVIFLDQWLKEEKHYSSLIGLAASTAMLLIFGPERFLIPTMLLILLLLTVFRQRIITGGERTL